MNLLEHQQTARLRLTRISAADLDDLVTMYSDPQVTATLGGMRTPGWVEHYLEQQIAHWQEHGFGLWMVRDAVTGQFAGRGGLRRALVDGRPEVELTYGFRAEYWGRGLATELACASVRLAFEELRLPSVVCFTLPTNSASQRVMIKAGFRYERDIVWADLAHVLYRLHAS